MNQGLVIERNGFTVAPLTSSCHEVWETREHVVFGVSPGNSYFSVDRLRIILNWLRNEFRQVDVIIPDESLQYTFRALGYSAEKSLKKSRAETNVLRNRVVRAWRDIGGPRSRDGLHRISELSSDSTYTDGLAECTRETVSDPVLSRACKSMTKDVLASKGLEGEPDGEQIAEAKKYLLAELPFFVASRKIFDVDTSLNFYHKPLPLAEVIFLGETTLKVETGQGYATIRAAEVVS